MKSIVANYKTTAAGAALILGALGDFATQLSTGNWDGTRLMADFSAFVGGVGLVVAKDGNVTGGTVKQ